MEACAGTTGLAVQLVGALPLCFPAPVFAHVHAVHVASGVAEQGQNESGFVRLEYEHDHAHHDERYQCCQMERM